MSLHGMIHEAQLLAMFLGAGRRGFARDEKFQSRALVNVFEKKVILPSPSLENEETIEYRATQTQVHLVERLSENFLSLSLYLLESKIHQ